MLVTLRLPRSPFPTQHLILQLLLPGASKPESWQAAVFGVLRQCLNTSKEFQEQSRAIPVGRLRPLSINWWGPEQLDTLKLSGSLMILRRLRTANSLRFSLQWLTTPPN